MVRRLTAEPAQEEDLIQEAIIHLWLREKEKPGQRHSWYIQSCRLHLQNFLRKGRSVDGGKRRRATVKFELETPNGAEPSVEGSPLSLVCARDLLAELGKWLTPVEKRTLNLMHDGLSLREVAARLDLSHTTILRHRRNIAALTRRLRAIAAPSNGRPRAVGST